MSEIDTSEFEINMDCPFCGANIVTAYDFSKIPDDLPEEEREEITCNGLGDDYISSPCEHLAFFSDWAYAGHSITPEWNMEMLTLAAALSGDEGFLSGKSTGLRGVESVIADSLTDTSEEELDKLMKKKLGKYKYAYEENYVEKFDGVSSGGPTYRLIFLSSDAD